MFTDSRGKICIEYSDVTNYNCNWRGLLTIKGNPAFRQVTNEDIGSYTLTNALKLSLDVTDQWSSG